MTSPIDRFTSYTLKHLREQWWDDEFTEFLAETLKPRPGNRILDVGCGEGLAEVTIGRLHISQVRQFGVDHIVDKVLEASRTTRGHNLRAAYTAGDARALPFRDASFDSVYCVAVLQHIDGMERAVAECARVTVPQGRIVAVEPNNATRFLHSSVPAGQQAFEASETFFSAVDSGRGRGARVGSSLPSLFTRHGIEPVAVRLFPVSHAWLGPPPAGVWEARRSAITRLMGANPPPSVSQAGRAYLDALAAYEAEARTAGAWFVEIQNTLLFATVGQRQT